VALAASYIRTESEGGLPTEDEQMASIVAYAADNGHDLVAHYKDLDAPGLLLYHRPGLKEAINNIKELEEWAHSRGAKVCLEHRFGPARVRAQTLPVREPPGVSGTSLGGPPRRYEALQACNEPKIGTFREM
jgi:hypothetical protein